MIITSSTTRFLLHFISRQWIKFVSIILISIVWAANDTIFPYFLKRIIDILQSYQGPPQHIYHALQMPLIFMASFWFISEILQRVQGIMQIYIFPRFRANIRESVFQYVKLHSHEYFANHFAGNLAKKLADLPTSSQTILEITCLQFIAAFTGTTIILVLAWLTKPLFAVILFTWLFIHLGLTMVCLRYGDPLWESHADSVSVLSGKIVDAFTNILNVRLFSRGDYESAYLKKFQNEEIVKAKKAMWRTELTRIGLSINTIFLVFLIFFVLLKGWINKTVTIGDFTQISMQTFWLLNWMWFIGYQMTVFTRESATIRAALSLINKKHDLVDYQNATKLHVQHGEINFKNVHFTYPQNTQEVFANLNVTIKSGEKVGLVGFSGSGKSTFVNLILRFYDVTKGEILIDGQNIAKVTQDSLRSSIAMIPQDPSLFHRTLMENIRYGRLNASDEEVIQAAKLAHCHEFIEQLDEGYNALVGERGVKLSGGQRQRVSIARAILKNAPILILDEATSALDSVTEKLIHESLQHLMQGKTTIAIAHRLSTLSDMDRILVFHKGQIIEEGNKEELLRAKGHFAKLWEMQIDGVLPETT